MDPGLPMSVSRDDLTGTLLRRDRHSLDIKVLVAGGEDASGLALDSAELLTIGEVVA